MEYVSGVPELNYMSQIVIMLYEDPTKDALSEERFQVELHFSPGVVCVCLFSLNLDQIEMHFPCLVPPAKLTDHCLMFRNRMKSR